jgi:hypothetical protein
MGQVYLTYENNEICDGFFAQIQRILAIYSIARLLNLNYYHSKIANITVTQLDPIQDEKKITEFLMHADKMFDNFKVVSLPSEYETISLAVPRIIDILKLAFKSKIQDRNILIKITNPFAIIEKFPSAYKFAIKDVKLLSTKLAKFQGLVVIHIRRGVTMSHILPGEENPRTLSDDYYLKLAKEITLRDEELEIVILTDAPPQNMDYYPPKRDLFKWKEFSKNKIGELVNIEGHEFKAFQTEYPTNLQIIRGGDLLTSLNYMARANHFIMSRSSMSFVGALLNKTGVIYYPPNFWHKPLKNWIKSS